MAGNANVRKEEEKVFRRWEGKKGIGKKMVFQSFHVGSDWLYWSASAAVAGFFLRRGSWKHTRQSDPSPLLAVYLEQRQTSILITRR